jgi:uncharacterized protein with HEPN domain
MSQVSNEQFVKDEMLQDAVIKRLEVIGEEIKKLTVDFVTRYPQVEWSAIARTRDKLVHNYFGTDLDIVFNIIKEDLPLLKKQITAIIKAELKKTK